jgi:hypothetical protein
MSTLPKAIYMFNASPIKFHRHSSQRLKKSTLKSFWNHKRPWLAKAIQGKKSNAGGITIPDFKLYYRPIAIKTAWYWQKNKHEDQWNRIENPDMNPHSHAYLIFNKSTQNIQWRKDSLLNKCWANWISAGKSRS